MLSSPTLSPKALDALRDFAISENILSVSDAKVFHSQAMKLDEVKQLIERCDMSARAALSAKLDALASEECKERKEMKEATQVQYGSSQWTEYVRSLPPAPQPQAKLCPQTST